MTKKMFSKIDIICLNQGIKIRFVSIWNQDKVRQLELSIDLFQELDIVHLDKKVKIYGRVETGIRKSNIF